MPYFHRIILLRPSPQWWLCSLQTGSQLEFGNRQISETETTKFIACCLCRQDLQTFQLPVLLLDSLPVLLYTAAHISLFCTSIQPRCHLWVLWSHAVVWLSQPQCRACCLGEKPTLGRSYLDRLKNPCPAVYISQYTAPLMVS